MYRPSIGHTKAIHKLHISHYSLKCKLQMDHCKYEKNEGGCSLRLPLPHFLDMMYGPIHGLHCRLYMVYVQLMYGPMWLVYDMYGLYNLSLYRFMSS